MSFYPEFDDLSLADLISRFEASPPEGSEYAAVYYGEVARLIGQKGTEGEFFLMTQLHHADPPRLRAIIFALTSGPEMPLTAEELQSYLSDERPEIVAEAIDGLRRRGLSEATARVLSLAMHESPYVRGSVLRFMSRLHPDQALSLLIDAVNDPDFIVRENAADEMGELGKPEALPYLRSLLADSNSDVRQAAETAIETLEAKSVSENNVDDNSDLEAKG